MKEVGNLRYYIKSNYPSYIGQLNRDKEVKHRRLRWDGHVARMDKQKINKEFW
jgi:hypothetical protein